MNDKVEHIMEECDVDILQAYNIAKRVDKMYDSFLMGYTAALEDVADDSVPQGDGIESHVIKRCAEKHSEVQQDG